MTLHPTFYVVTIKGFESVYEFNNLEYAFDLIKRCMPCEASIKAKEE